MCPAFLLQGSGSGSGAGNAFLSQAGVPHYVLTDRSSCNTLSPGLQTQTLLGIMVVPSVSAPPQRGFLVLLFVYYRGLNNYLHYFGVPYYVYIVYCAQNPILMIQAPILLLHTLKSCSSSVSMKARVPSCAESVAPHKSPNTLGPSLMSERSPGTRSTT